MFWLRCCFLSHAFLRQRSTATPTRKHATNRIAVTTTAKDAPKFSRRKRKLWKTATNSVRFVRKRKKNLLKKVKSNPIHLCQPKRAGIIPAFFIYRKSDYSFEIFDRSSKPFVKRYLGFPSEKFSGKSYVGAAHTRVVTRKRQECEF